MIPATADRSPARDGHVVLYRDPGQPVAARVADLLSRMTLPEKAAQLGSCWVYQVMGDDGFAPEKATPLFAQGIGQITRLAGASSLKPRPCAELANAIQRHLREETRLGIPALIHEESCSGYMARHVTCFPQTIGLSCTWEPELVEEMARIIRDQMRLVGARQALAPLLDVCRDPRWGRAEETFGEDPYLVARLGTAYVRGLQGETLSQGVLATGKHFVGYGISEGGMNWAPAHIPARELREVYLLPFEAAVREGRLASLMPGYHELDGVPCHASQALLRDTLRGEWGFDGIVVSDYFAILQLHDYHQVAADPTAAAQLALAAGVDVELPNTACYGDVLVDAVKSGQIAEALLDEVVGRVLAMKIRLGLFEDPFVDAAAALDVSDTPAQRETALRIARKSIVLLKNKQQTLPLRKDLRSIAVIGPNADTIRNLLGDYTYPSHIETLIAVKKEKNTFNQPLPPDISEQDLFLPMTSILARIREKVSAATAVLAAPGCDISDSSADGLAKAAAAASKADVAVVVVGDKSGLTRSCTVGESRDMASLRLPGIQEQLVHAVCATGTPTVVVLVSGRPYAIPGIASEAAAIVEAWLPGEEGAQAVADALFGDYNPGGKLTLSFPRDAGQIPVYYGHKKSGGRSHWFGDYVDMSAQPLYPFGHGLSYTTFEYTNLRISEPEAGLDGAAVISADIRNTGDVAGEEVVQLYIRDSHASVTRPVKELKGFVRIALAAGETKRVTFTLSPRQLGYYNQDMAYGIEPGSIEVMIGSSSEDIRLQGSFNITGPVWMDVPEKAYFSNVTVTPALSPKTA